MNKQVVIKGREDDWYEKAVFLLKKEPPHQRMNLASEANYIIGNYMKTNPIGQETPHLASKQCKQQKWIDLFFYGSVTMLVITSIVYFI
ncbi:MAG: hypothetical protein ACRCTE_14545 [Cellulosilyticaceae bacterium]